MNLEQSDAEAAAVAVAPRVSLADMEAKIAARYDIPAYAALESWQRRRVGTEEVAVHSALKVLSICILVMQNGFTIIGKSAPANAENYNEALGSKLAYEDAVRQLWPLEGYLLRQRTFEGW